MFKTGHRFTNIAKFQMAHPDLSRTHIPDSHGDTATVRTSRDMLLHSQEEEHTPYPKPSWHSEKPPSVLPRFCRSSLSTVGRV